MTVPSELNASITFHPSCHPLLMNLVCMLLFQQIFSNISNSFHRVTKTPIHALHHLRLNVRITSSRNLLPTHLPLHRFHRLKPHLSSLSSLSFPLSPPTHPSASTPPHCLYLTILLFLFSLTMILFLRVSHLSTISFQPSPSLTPHTCLACLDQYNLQNDAKALISSHCRPPLFSPFLLNGLQTVLPVFVPSSRRGLFHRFPTHHSRVLILHRLFVHTTLAK
ncbi:hypothetical protein BLNAU_21777 [Blattamonas nauphoetae]|uniref:Uncharacterized protein n=1 Tax=Blattamonas nauphoetae TaxID=2049346 RepID=A0ABQ9WZ59_9EUKA|nr:hypothetical protein BLNAU_21777 [Blattamonas nauphoetae]